MGEPTLKDIVIEHHMAKDIWIKLFWSNNDRQTVIIRPPFTRREVLHALDTLQILIATDERIKISNKNFHGDMDDEMQIELEESPIVSVEQHNKSATTLNNLKDINSDTSEDLETTTLD